MSKVGRNAPCPCGSGKKYKRCCLAKDGALPDLANRPDSTSGDTLRSEVSAFLGGGPRLHPYVLAKWCEDERLMEKVRRKRERQGAGKMRFLWTPSKLAAMSTEEIDQRLRDVGVDPSPQRFLELAKGYTSAWELSEVWRREVPEDRFDDAADDFVGVAACELWKRYCPERPSVEMLDDWMQEGYVHDMAQRATEACDIWLRLWAVLASRLTPEMTTFEAADELVAGTQCVGNWLQDFILSQRNATNDDPKYAEQGIAVLERTLGQFVDSGARGRATDRTDLAHLHFRLGHDENGERILLDLIEEHPDMAAGYVGLSDELSHHLYTGGPPKDLERAIALLRQALDRPVVDAADWDVERRLQHLLEDRESTTA